MPHIQINLWPGRTEEKMKDFANKLVDLAVEELGAKREAFTVGVTEVQPENWDEFVRENVKEEEIILDGKKEAK